MPARRTLSIDILLSLCWAVLNICLVLLYNSKVLVPLNTTLSRFLLVFGVGTLSYFESILVIGILRAVLKTGRFKFIILSVIALVLCFILSLIAGSWLLENYSLGFITQSTLLGFLYDTKGTLKHFTYFEWKLAKIALAVGASVTTLLLFIVYKTKSTGIRLLVSRAVFSLVLVVFCLRLLPYYLLDEEKALTFKSVCNYSSNPNLSLIWSPLLFFELESGTEIIEDLVPREDLDAYFARIETKAERKNIILIIVEALRADVIYTEHQNKEITPNINKLANTGFFFPRTFAQSSESSYSTTSLITGLYPLKYPTRDRFVKNTKYAIPIYDFLSSTYRTGYISSANEYWQNMHAILGSKRLDTFQHAGNTKLGTLPVPKLDIRYAESVSKGKLKTGKLNDAQTIKLVQKFIDKAIVAAPHKPFFVATDLQASHFPFEQGLLIDPVFTPNEISEEDKRKISFLSYPERLLPVMKNRYYNSLYYMDHLIGLLVEHLKDRTIFNETALIIVGDQGSLFYEHGEINHGGQLWNEVLNVPLIIHNVDKTGVVTDVNRALIDVAPTILEIAELPSFAGLQGLSVLSSAVEERPIYSSVQIIAQQDAVIVGDKKLMVNRFNNESRLYTFDKKLKELDNKKLDQDKITELKEKLDAFRNRQLSYYANRKQIFRYFPPTTSLETNS